MASWKYSTKKQYHSYIKKWFIYCRERKIDKFQTTLENVIEFFTVLFEKGLGYSCINTVRSALSALGLYFDNVLVGHHPLVIRFLREVFNIRPSKPRYTHIWDVQKVLNFLRGLSPVKYLGLKDLTLKLTCLLALTNATRAQSLHLICVNNVNKLKSEFVFEMDGLIKQSRPGYKEPNVICKAYPPDRRLCTYTVLKEYISRTRKFRSNTGNNRLLLSYVKPHKQVTSNTISRWIKTVLSRSGIDTKIFGSHSVRSASTSKAKINAVPLESILQKAGWSNVKTFAKFYDKKIIIDNFAEGVLRP